MDNKTYITYEDDNLLELCAYKRSTFRLILVIFLCVFTFGLLGLVFYWKPTWYLRFTCHRCTPGQASHVLLKDKWKDEYVEVVIEGDLHHKCNHIKVSKKSFGDKLMMDNAENIQLVSNNNKDPFSVESFSKVRYFIHRQLKFIWSHKKQIFGHIRMPEIKCSYFHNNPGLTASEANDRLCFYGENFIRIKLTPILVILVSQTLTPFYIFQIYSVLLWIFGESYYFYSGCVIFMSLLALTATVYQISSTERNLKKTISAVSKVFVKRTENGGYKSMASKYIELSTDLLVPGDVIKILSNGYHLPCDAVIISGSAVLNEARITGESVPITKTAISSEDDNFREKEHSKSVLFCGTIVLQTRAVDDRDVLAVVTKTGYNTVKGSLARSIMYPKSMDFKFVSDSYKYIAALAVICSLGMVYTVVVMTRGHVDTKVIIMRVVSFITIAIPPILPATMTFCIAVSQFRLKRKNIFCLNSKSIIVCGSIDTFCFDKTGTLTEDGMDVHCVHPCLHASFTKPTFVDLNPSNASEITEKEEDFRKISTIHPNLILSMASCHSIASINGTLCGDPLDLKIFGYTQWLFLDKKHYETPLRTPVAVKSNINSQKVYGLAKEFPFSSSLQRMMVVVYHEGGFNENGEIDSGKSNERSMKKDKDKIHKNNKDEKNSLHHFTTCVKGSPERIRSLCVPETIPEDFQRVLVRYTEEGFRVIAMAYKPLFSNVEEENLKEVWTKLNSINRSEVESSLIFLGLVIMENKVKPQSSSTILKLKQAAFKTVMVTGDNLLTALSVARKCNFIDQPLYLASITTDNNGYQPRAVLCSIKENKQTKDVLKESQMDLCALEDANQGPYYIAITGNTWNLYTTHFPHLLPQLVEKGVVFARFSPEQKQQLVEQLQSLGHYVGMCGDGANDCGALKAAHAGIALTDTEASVAAPFTSKQNDIVCVDNVIREGRCALTTSFGIFKVMAGYALNLFLVTCFFIWEYKLMPDIQYLYIDILIMIPIAITFCFISCNDHLVPRKPPISLVALTPLLSLILNLFLSFLSILLIFNNCTYQPWYSEDPIGYKLACVFLVSITQNVTMAVVFSQGPPFQKKTYTNYSFMITVVLTSIANYLTIIASNDWWAGVIDLKMPPLYSYRYFIASVTIIHFFVCYFVEKVLIDRLIEPKVQPFLVQYFFKNNLNYENRQKQHGMKEWNVIEMNFERFMANETNIENIISNSSKDK